MSEMFVWPDQTPTVITTTDDATGLTLTTYVHAAHLVPEEAAEYVAEAAERGGPVTVPTAVVKGKPAVLPLKEYVAALETVAEKEPELIPEEVADATQ